MSKYLKLLLISTSFNLLTWMILIPLWQYPDEQAHFAQVQDTSEIGSVPVGTFDTSYEIALSERILGTDRDNLGNNRFTYHSEYKIDYSKSYFGPHELEISYLPKSARVEFVKNESTNNPPLYYFLGSLVYKVFSDHNLFMRVYAVRIMSAIFFLMTVLVGYKIGKILFEENQTLSICLASLIAFMPMLVFASTGVLPDALTNLLFSVVIYLGLKTIAEGFSFSVMTISIITIVAGVMTRQQFSIAIIIFYFPIIYQILATGKNAWRSFLILFASTVFMALASILGTKIPLISSLRFHDSTVSSINLFFKKNFIAYVISITRETYTQILPWYFGVYKWLSLTYPMIIYKVIKIILLFAAAGLLIKTYLIISNRRYRGKFIFLVFLIYSSIVYYLAIILWNYLFQSASGFSFGIQGRYFFPLIVAHASIFLIGLWQIGESFRRKYSTVILLATVALVLLFNDYSLIYVSSHYYDTNNLALFIKQASQYKPPMLKGYVILLVMSINFLFQIFFLYKIGSLFINKNTIKNLIL